MGVGRGCGQGSEAMGKGEAWEVSGEQKSERRSDSLVIRLKSHFPLTRHQAGTSSLSGVAQGAGHLGTWTGVSSDLVSGNHYSLE